jgi:hypothetical protein
MTRLHRSREPARLQKPRRPSIGIIYRTGSENRTTFMFGISPLGWVHTLGSLPAIPLAIYMFARHGRIVPRSVPGALYFVSMLIGATTVFLVAVSQ